MKKVFVLLFNGYADWETGYILPQLQHIGGLKTATIGFTGEPVTSMGGLTVSIDYTLDNIPEDDIAILIIPGGNMWESYTPAADLLALLNRLASRRTPIAGICAATTLVVRAGLCRGLLHTSNSLEYLTDIVPEYRDHITYVDTPAIRDNSIITASGLGAIDFTLQIMNELEIATPEIRTAWFNAFKHGVIPDSFR